MSKFDVGTGSGPASRVGTQKTQKKPTGLVFFKKTRVFSNPASIDLESRIRFRIANWIKTLPIRYIG
jgi:hypothetical protein